MSEKISALMDGELGAHEQHGCFAELAGEGDAITAWRDYHVVGDALRNTSPLSAGFATRVTARLAAEPTVVAPHRPYVDAHRRWRALQVAASLAAVALVAWMALLQPDTVQRKPEVALAKPAAEAPAVRVPLPSAAADYLLAHQAYSPRGNLQGVAPYVRSVSESVRRR